MEQELKDHALKAVEVIKNKELSFWHKTIEILKEVIIIVFAVTLSIWFHDMSEDRRQQKEVKEFLVKLKLDLASDIKEMKEDETSFQNTAKAFQYISTNKPNVKLSIDSVRKHQRYIFNSIVFWSHNSRYEGFKSSGKLGNIDDAQLQNDITDLYQDIIPSIIVSTEGFAKRKELIFEYLYKNIKTDANGNSNLPEVLATDEVKNICNSLGSSYVDEITGRYEDAIKKSEKVIAAIEHNYPGE